MNYSRRTKGELIEEVTALKAQLAAREQARERAQLLCSAVEQCSGGTAVADLDGRLRFVNAAFARMHGYEPAELAGQHLSVFHPADQLAEANAADAQLRRTGAFQGVIRHTRRDGTTFPVLLNGSLLRDPAGQAAGIVWTTQDFTQQQRAEDAIREREERFRTLIENAPIGVYRTTPDGRIVTANPALVKMLGYTSFEELAARNLEKKGFHAPYPRSEFRSRIEREGTIVGLEAAWTRRDGSIITVRESARVVRDATGRAIYYDGTVEDISERKQTEEQLRSSRAFLQTVIDAVPEVTMVVDRQYRVVLANRAACEAAGGDPVARGLTCHEVSHHRNVPCADLEGICPLNFVVENKKPLTTTHVHTNAQGRTTVVEIAVAPILNEAGEVEQIVEACRDITARRQTEVALRQNEELLRTVVNATHEAFISIGDDGRVTLFNRAAEQMFGRSADEMVGRPLDCLMPEEYWDRHANYVRSYFATGQPSGAVGRIVELPGLRRGGEVFPLEVSLSAGQVGDRKFVTAVARDITERKRTEQALGESEARLRQIIDLVPHFVFAKDREGRFILVNQAVADAYGHSVEEILGKTDADFDPNAQEVEHFLRDDREVIDSGRPKLIPVEQITDCTGRLRLLQTTKIPFSVAGTEAPAVLGVAVDITEQKRAEETLREREEALRDLFENANDLIISVRPDGRLAYANRAWRECLGYAEDEVAGLPLFETIHPSDREHCASLLGTVVSGRAVTSTEAVFVSKDGRAVVVEGNCNCRLRDGQPQAIRGIFRDITLRRQAEQAECFRAAFDTLITAISTRFINLPTDAVDQEIASALQQIGEFAGVDRSYVFQFSPGGRLMTNTHEWCAEGIAAMRHRLVDLPADDLPWFTERIRRPEVVHVPRVADLGPDAAAEKHEWEFESIQSLICVPMVCAGKLLGFVGLDSVRAEKAWPDEIIALLRIVGDILANALARRSAERALQESQRMLATLMSNLPGMAYRCRNDPEWTLEFASDGCFSLTGHEPADLINNAKLSYAQLIHPEDRLAVWDDVQAALRVRKPFHLLYRIISANGQQKWVWEQGRGVFSPSGELLALEGFIGDITERVQAEEALRASEARFRALVETTSDWVWEVDRDGRYRYASPKVKDLLGYEPEEIIGRTAFDLMPAADAKRFARAFKRITARRQPFKGLENLLLDKQGRELTLETSGVPILDARGDLIGYRGIDRDVTERKRTEQALRQAERLAALGTTVAGVAHELNNPLTGICGLSDLLARNPSLNREAVALANDILEQGRRCAQIVENLLGFARERRVTREQVSLNAAVDHCVRLSRHDARFDGVEIEVDCAPDLPDIMAGRYQLEQVLVNVINNAADAVTGNAGPKRVSVRTWSDGQSVFFSVRDNGHGIANPTKVFDPFYTTKRIGSGTGLGLSVSYGIVEEHGGRITAENVGDGACFTVRLPIAAPPASPVKTQV